MSDNQPFFGFENTFMAERVLAHPTDPNLADFTCRGYVFTNHTHSHAGIYNGRSASSAMVILPDRVTLWRVWWWDDQVIQLVSGDSAKSVNKLHEGEK